MRIIKHENGKKYLLWQITIFVGGWLFFFAFLFLILPWSKESNLPSLIKGVIACIGIILFMWGIWGPFIQVPPYHAWPAAKFTEEKIFVKSKKSFNVKSYLYTEITDIQEAKTQNGDLNLYYLTLTFFNGDKWETLFMDEQSRPQLEQLSKFLSQKSNLQATSQCESVLAKGATS